MFKTRSQNKTDDRMQQNQTTNQLEKYFQ